MHIYIYILLLYIYRYILYIASKPSSITSRASYEIRKHMRNQAHTENAIIIHTHTHIRTDRRCQIEVRLQITIYIRETIRGINHSLLAVTVNTTWSS